MRLLFYDEHLLQIVELVVIRILLLPPVMCISFEFLSLCIHYMDSAEEGKLTATATETTITAPETTIG